jgi:hypothetical protein
MKHKLPGARARRATSCNAAGGDAVREPGAAVVATETRVEVDREIARAAAVNAAVPVVPLALLAQLLPP